MGTDIGLLFIFHVTSDPTTTWPETTERPPEEESKPMNPYLKLVLFVWGMLFAFMSLEIIFAYVESGRPRPRLKKD